MARKILALEPFYAGSHRAMLEGWRQRSVHEWTVLGLPGHKWKWRMRHAPITFARQLAESHAEQKWDVLFCSDMLSLAEFRGLADESIRRLPTVVYFHENQFTYPVQEERERDLHFAMTNLTTALAADQLWFNSQFHREEFFTAIDRFLARVSDYAPEGVVGTLHKKSLIQPPGIDPMPARTSPRSNEMSARPPLKILFSSRWEFDKQPELLLEALNLLEERGVSFRLSILGESFREQPESMAVIGTKFADWLDHFGYLDSRAEYIEALLNGDVIVSTAIHEFFGIGVVEAMSAGAYPLLPNRLAYPELLAPLGEEALKHLYDGSAEDLANRLEKLAGCVSREGTLLSREKQDRLLEAMQRFQWPERAKQMDEAIGEISNEKGGRSSC